MTGLAAGVLRIPIIKFCRRTPRRSRCQGSGPEQGHLEVVFPFVPFLWTHHEIGLAIAIQITDPDDKIVDWEGDPELAAFEGGDGPFCIAATPAWPTI